MNKAANHFDIRIVKKNEYFFHEGEPSKFFAGLIKGKICFKKSKIINRKTGEAIYKALYKAVEKKEDFRIDTRKFSSRDYPKSNKIKQNMGINKGKMIDPKRISVFNLPHLHSLKSKYSLSSQPYKIVKEYFDPQYYEVTEDVLFLADPGYCFGEWALIYNQPRSASVIALEDSVFFILDEKIFAKTFLKCLNNSEHRKKKFILENLFPFNLYNNRRNTLYKDVIPKSFVRNQIIFNEGEIADTIYLIYSGTFYLEKYFKNKIYRFKSVEKGTLLGLECIFEENAKYKCTLRLSSLNEFGMVACCHINKLLPYVIQKMKHSFKKNYELYINSNEEFYENNINYEKNILFKKKTKDEETSENLQKIIEDYSTIEKNEILKNKKIKFNFLKQVKLDKNQPLSKTERNITIENTDSPDVIRRKGISRTKRAFKTMRKNKKAKTIKLNKLKNYDNFVFKNVKDFPNYKRSLFKRMNTIMPFSKKIKFQQDDEINKNIEENNKILNTDLNNDNKIKKLEREENKINVMKITKYNINKYVKDLLSYNYKPNIIEDLKEKSKNIKNNLKKEKIMNKTFYGNFKYKKFKNQISRNTQFEENHEENITNFTEFSNLKSNKKKKFRFDSGKYNLPLMAQIFKKSAL